MDTFHKVHTVLLPAAEATRAPVDMTNVKEGIENQQ
jgi:hypothetical protein